MPIFRLDRRLAFPRPELAEPDGVLAVGGDLQPERLLLAYSVGIFPWYSEGLPIIWHAPDPRMVLLPDELHVPRSLRKAMRKRPYELRIDSAFADVITACAAAPRPDQDSTWITGDMREAYIDLHDLGYAHSVEAYAEGQLVGGLYGVSLGGAFFGESMFARAPDASKIAFVSLVQMLAGWGFSLIDCQVYTDHLSRFGAKDIPRAEFSQRLASALKHPTRCGSWADASAELGDSP